MTQADMDWQTFTSIIDKLQASTVVSLQGEGEPTLHPRFWEMVKYVHDRGMRPYTIINASRVNVPDFAYYFPEIGVSLDTLNPEVATRLGRYGLQKVLFNLKLLRENLGAGRVTIMTVNFGQELTELRRQVREWGHPHIVQPRQAKEDYGRLAGYSVVAVHSRRSSTCVFLEQPQRRFYTVAGLELPCCFMKDTSEFHSVNRLKHQLISGDVPAGCRGCGNLEYK